MDTQNLLHGDLQMGNLILNSQSTPDCFWIDLGRAAHGLPLFDLGHLFLFCNVFSKTAKVQEIAHMTEQQMSAFWNAFALAYNGPDKLEEFNTACKRFAALDVILLGHIQKLNWHQRLFLGFLAKRLFKASGI